MELKRNIFPKDFVVAFNASLIDRAREGAEAADLKKEENGFLDTLLNILHLLGITDEQIIEFFGWFADGVEAILAKLPPEDVQIVELAAGDLLGMMQTGQYDSERLQADLNIIYTIMWPYVDPDVKPILEKVYNLLIWVWEHVPSYPQHPIGDKIDVKLGIPRYPLDLKGLFGR